MTNLSDRLITYTGDSLATLKTMLADSVDCIVTSPPYWGLRDYGVAGQMGLEPTLANHIAAMVKVFDECKRVLKPSGTCWVNYGDCYATTPNGRSAAKAKELGNDDRTFRDKPFSTIGGVLKQKDLAMVPNRFAIAMQEAGWWVRSEIIWAKPNPMPESARDRPATSHEKIFLFTKAPHYFFDSGAVRQGLTQSMVVRLSRDIEHQTGSFRKKSGKKVNDPANAIVTDRGQVPGNTVHFGLETKWDKMTKREQCGNVRNLRNYESAPIKVWNIATRPFRDAHFATFPPELAERCILSGCPKNGVVLDPVGGAGTTALVALRHNRRAILIELNPDYMEIAKKRIADDWHVPAHNLQQDFGPLFEKTEAAE